VQFLVEADLLHSEGETDAVIALSDADLIGADLQGADLSEADLVNADLRDADLRDANFTDAKGVTQEELSAHALGIQGATMPDGSKHP
jgi:uncharacterized protein YjbI with pentapeptide repeats